MIEEATGAERKDFQEWKVSVVFMAQEGICAKCSNSLMLGFHRHHKNEDPTDISLENLELHCPECHRATLKGPKKRRWLAHRRYEKKIFLQLNELITSSLGGKMSGATAERLMEAMSLGLKISRRINDVDGTLEFPPPSFTIFRKFLERDTLSEAYLEGFRSALRAFNIKIEGRG